MRILFTLLAPLFLLPAEAPTAPAPYGVRDEVHFFSADAAAQATQVIDQINQAHRRDLLVETFPEIPQKIPQNMKQDLEKEGKDKFFSTWAQTRALEQNVNGVYILVCKNPSRLQVAVGNVTERQLFTTADRDELAKKMLKSFREKQFDQGLLDGVRFVQQRMDAHDKHPDNAKLSASNAFPGDRS